MIEFHDVAYKDIIKIDNLVIREGEVTCLVGKSGGGKSTLLKLLNKTISPTRGKILYKGEDLAAIDSVEHRRRVVYLNQKPHLFPGTIKDNLLQGFYFQRRKAPSDEALQDVLEWVRLRKPLSTDVANFSGGEAQRLALARVLLLDAEVYLFDEPSSALDDETEDIVLDTVVRCVKEKKKTLVMVTHSKEHARRHADSIHHMHEGRLQGGGKT